MSQILSLLLDAKNKAEKEVKEQQELNKYKKQILEETQKGLALSFIKDKLPDLIEVAIKNHRDYIDINLLKSEFKLLADSTADHKGTYQGAKYIQLLPGRSKFLFEILSAEHLFPQLFYEWFPNREDSMNHFQDFRCYIRIYLCYIKG